MAHDVFVSYSHKDKQVADAVVSGLENRGIRCWFAPRDVTPGTSWGEAIVQAIESSKVMIIILSKNSNQSRQVVREVERAVAADVIIIPFRIENITPSGAMSYFLSSEHWLDALSPPLEKHIEMLGNTVQLFLSGEGGTVDTEPRKVVLTPASKKLQPSRRRLLTTFLLSTVFIILLGILLYSFWPEIRSSVLGVTDSTPAAANPVMASTEASLPGQQAECGTLKLDSINPATIIEGVPREYRLVGSGFCENTEISITGYALVGNSPNGTNGRPVEVANDGTWLSVFISPDPAPDQSGAYVIVENPDGDSSTLYVNFER